MVVVCQDWFHCKSLLGVWLELWQCSRKSVVVAVVVVSLVVDDSTIS